VTPDVIISELKATDRWQAIEELVNALADQKAFDENSRLAVTRAIRLREATNTTGIGRGTALPHASGPFVNRVVIAFGRSSAGIDFDSADKLPVYSVLLFATPQGQFQTHLNLLAKCSRLFQDDATREALCGARDAAEIARILGGCLA
jgi:mannitol/fructose-specific phosphotransferase system IIA component (Ntr-type)